MGDDLFERLAADELVVELDAVPPAELDRIVGIGIAFGLRPR